MQILESGEMYLETILILSKKSRAVRSIDVSGYMGFSKPSVSRAIGLLKKGGYIKVDAEGLLSLTETGTRIANKIYSRHKLLTEFFIRLGIDGKTAAEDACKVEHSISAKTFAAINRHAREMKG